MPDFFRSSPGYTFPSYGSRFPEKRILLQRFGMRICSMKMKSHPEGWAVIGMRMRDSIADLSKANRNVSIPSSRNRAKLHRSFAFRWVRIPRHSNKKCRYPDGYLHFWQRMRDSNPRKRSQSPVCYRYTNPLYGGDNRTRTCDLMRVKHAL